MPSGIYLRTKEHRAAISRSRKGHFVSEETKRKIGLTNSIVLKGHRHSEATKSKMSVAHIGNKNALGKTWNLSRETKLKQSLAAKGKKKPLISGERHWNWRGGLSSLNSKLRNSLEYKNWRNAVFARDNYTCVICKRSKEVSGSLNADHIKPFAYFPELMFLLENGRTLCIDCHRNTDNYFYKSRWKNTIDLLKAKRS